MANFETTVTVSQPSQWATITNERGFIVSFILFNNGDPIVSLRPKYNYGKL